MRSSDSDCYRVQLQQRLVCGRRSRRQPARGVERRTAGLNSAAQERVIDAMWLPAISTVSPPSDATGCPHYWLERGFLEASVIW